MTEISGTWAKYLECRMDIIKYKELYEKDLQIWKRIPDVYAAELRCPSIPQYEILLLHYDRQVVDIINNVRETFFVSLFILCRICRIFGIVLFLY